jgi:hypothetical protein
MNCVSTIVQRCAPRPFTAAHEFKCGMISPVRKLDMNCFGRTVLQPSALMMPGFWSPYSCDGHFSLWLRDFEGKRRLCRWFSRTFGCNVIKTQELLKASLRGEFTFRIIQPETPITTTRSDTYTATRKFLGKIS